MNSTTRAFIDFEGVTLEDVETLFSVAHRFEKHLQLPLVPHTLGLIFLEPSTRTRCSFEVAGLKLGLRVFNLESAESSVMKGESLEDTLLNLDAMGPSLLVVRHGTKELLREIAPRLKSKIISGGEGITGHPTQALLDVLTIYRARKGFKKERVLIIGDVIHSRVAHSHFDLLHLIGFEIAVCGPREWLGIEKDSRIKHFSRLEEGLQWATIAMSLRIQKERHDKNASSSFEELVSSFQLNAKSLRHLSEDGFIMHPGPVNRDVEMTREAMEDSRCLILKQVNNGVILRGALMASMLGIKI
ncbi:MAG: aspartate carbamoyltransferase catalytic subunit [Bdellovibrionales bacterium]|nr:aspartate carbamoyltransferase catalytic subunit [Bdellovibrionales bacterium]